MDACCYPDCDLAVTVKVDEPLCDRHLISVYRSVVALSRREPSKTRRIGSRMYGTPGVVYFLRFGTRIKIGFTEDLDKRIRDIPHDEVLATTAGSLYAEGEIHRKFAHLRLTGEWFSMGEDLMAYIAALKTA